MYFEIYFDVASFTQQNIFWLSLFFILIWMDIVLVPMKTVKLARLDFYICPQKKLGTYRVVMFFLLDI